MRSMLLSYGTAATALGTFFVPALFVFVERLAGRREPKEDHSPVSSFEPLA